MTGLLRMAAILTFCSALCSCIRENAGTGTDLAAGDIIPDFSVVMNDGTVFNSLSLAGHPSCIVFFHTSCPDCRKALPSIQRIYDEFSMLGVRFICISREEGNENIEEYWEENGYTLPYSAQKDRKIYEMFATGRIPRVYICDKDMIIKNIHTDNPLPEYEDLHIELSALL